MIEDLNTKHFFLIFIIVFLIGFIYWYIGGGPEKWDKKTQQKESINKNIIKKIDLIK